VAIWPRKPDEPWTAVQNAVLGLLDLPAPLRQWLSGQMVNASSGAGQPTGVLARDAHRLLFVVWGNVTAASDRGGHRRNFAAVALAIVPTALAERAKGTGLYPNELRDLARAVAACMEQPKDARG
jgi:hypothetical protein